MIPVKNLVVFPCTIVVGIHWHSCDAKRQTRRWEGSAGSIREDLPLIIWASYVVAGWASSKFSASIVSIDGEIVASVNPGWLRKKMGK